jgi:hypothetical protein
MLDGKTTTITALWKLLDFGLPTKDGYIYLTCYLICINKIPLVVEMISSFELIPAIVLGCLTTNKLNCLKQTLPA